MRAARGLALVAGALLPGAAPAQSPMAPGRPALVDEVALDSEFARFLRRARPLWNRLAAVDAFMASCDSFPVVEGEDLVHFVYRGPGREVRLEGSLAGTRGRALHRLGGTDFFYASYRLAAGARLDYRFVIDGEGFATDPLNPHTAPERRGRGVVSELRMPGYLPPAHVRDPLGRLGGRLVDVSFSSAALAETRRLRVYLPHGYAPVGDRYPLLVVSSGFQALSLGRTLNSLDNLVNESVAPLVVAFVEARSPEELGGAQTVGYARLLADELVPFLESRYHAGGAPERRGILGTDYASAPALFAAVRYPGSFGKVALQSPHLSPPLGDESLLALAALSEPIDFYLDWNRWEFPDERGEDLEEHARRLTRALEERGLGYFGGEAQAGAGWASWRARTDRILEAFFPRVVDGRIEEAR